MSLSLVSGEQREEELRAGFLGVCSLHLFSIYPLFQAAPVHSQA